MALWDKIGSSGDVEDLRGSRSGLVLGGGITGILLTAALLFLSGQSAPEVLETILTQGMSTTSQQAPFEDSKNYKGFAEKVLGSTNDFWSQQFTKTSKAYEPPRLVLFRDITQSGCGVASSQVGPHYCPADK